MNMKTFKAIAQEADDCAKSADDQRNTPENRQIFHVLSIVLIGISDRLEYGERRKGLDDDTA